VVFDAPAEKTPFENRIEYLQDLFAGAKFEFASMLEHKTCNGLTHLKKELARVEAIGGEGLMLREPGSRYAVGRSSTLLKVKTFHDAEAIVLAHQPGKGKHKGRMGALNVQLPDGTEFSIGTGFSDKQRDSPPAIGSTVTFRYQELTDAGVPRFPSFVAVRKNDAPAKSSSKKPRR
jgi:DNA ligase-1